MHFGNYFYYTNFSLLELNLSSVLIKFDTFLFNHIREYQESRVNNERQDYPVLLVEDVNHGQVASGTKLKVLTNA